MAPGEPQVWSWGASGWTSRSFLVRFLYASSALLMISWKLEEDEAVG
jgi:hypothetical protein